MTEQTLFDLPKARASDPSPSHLAAARVKPARRALVEAIREVVGATQVARLPSGPITAFTIAQMVEQLYPRRWDSSTVRTAISTAGLRAVDTEGVSPRGQRCIRYELGPDPR